MSHPLEERISNTGSLIQTTQEVSSRRLRKSHPDDSGSLIQTTQEVSSRRLRKSHPKGKVNRILPESFQSDGLPRSILRRKLAPHDFTHPSLHHHPSAEKRHDALAVNDARSTVERNGRILPHLDRLAIETPDLSFSTTSQMVQIPRPKCVAVVDCGCFFVAKNCCEMSSCVGETDI